MGRDRDYPLTPELLENLERLLLAVNIVRAEWGKPLTVVSGYRPGHYNKQAKGARRSSHTICEACDFRDPDKSFAKWCLTNLDVLTRAGLYMENPDFTPTWVHLQIRPTKNRVFNP
jgi:uncharacterized protein YcbK (DUF882 family)